MNPCDYRTWKSLADHPVFSPRAAAYAEWSSDPDVYSDRHDLPAIFNPDWYVHKDPPLPASVQANCAAVDLQNLADICGALAQRYDRLDHELFILDDLTVYVRASTGRIALDIYPMHLDDSGAILMLFIKSPVEIYELIFTAVADVVPKLDSLVGNA